LEQPEKTSEDGTASCTVQTVHAAAGPVGRIDCSLVLEQMVPRAILSRISPPSVSFQYVVRSKANTWIAVHVDERTVGDAPAAEPVVRNAVVNALTKAGFQVLPEDRVAVDAADTSPGGEAVPEHLMEAFTAAAASLEGEGFLLALVAQVRTRLVEEVDTSVGRLYIQEASVVLRVFDVSRAQGTPVLVVRIAERDAYTDSRREAARRARVKAAGSAAREVTARLESKFAGR
jgi:hypothetical protein